MISEQVLQSIVENSHDSRAVDAIGQLVSRIHELEAALRQPQAARLTEELREIADLMDKGMGDTDPYDPDDPLLKASQKIWAILDSGRPTAAPAQVTREEIEVRIGAHVWCDDAFDGVRGVELAAKDVMSLLAERGLVKEG